MRLSEKFRQLRARGEKALVLFVTAGDPSLEDLPKIVAALREGGADIVEVGLPFSDPFGEGPTIQASSQRALDAGTTTPGVLAAMVGIEPGDPVVTMGYYNMVLRKGLGEFAQMTAEAGSVGAIINDLVPEEADAWCAAAAAAGQETIFLVAPTSTPERIRQAVARTTGFVYVVSRTGVTGSESQMPSDVGDLVRRVQAEGDVPCCVGFGISRPEHVRIAAVAADGVVVGSALVNWLHANWQGGDGRAELVAWVSELKEATRA